MATRGLLELLRLAEVGRRRGYKQNITKDEWSGIAFRVGKHLCVMPMGEVEEIMTMPAHITKVPKVVSWFIGLANIRGRVVLATDLSAYMGFTAAITSKQRKLIIIDQPNQYVGLLVDEVYGIKHFIKSTYNSCCNIDHEMPPQYFKGCFFVDNNTWHVCLASTIVLDNHFLNIGMVSA